MTEPNKPAETTEAEQKFLDGLMKLFAPEGGELVGIHKKVYEETKKQLAEQGEATLEDIMKAGSRAFSETYANAMQNANNEVFRATSDLSYENTPENEKALSDKMAAQERLKVLAARDKRDMMPQQTLALAKEAGLESGITKAEQKFLTGLKELINVDGDPTSFQEELYTNLYEAAAKKGEITAQKIKEVIEKTKESDIEGVKYLQEKYGTFGGIKDYDEAIQMPKIQKLIDKAHLQKDGRE